MIVRPPTLRPVKQAVALFDRQVVDARDPLLPEFLDKAVFQLARPLARQKGLDFVTASEEFGAVPPDAAGCIGERDARRIAAVPAIFGGAHLLCRAYGGKGGEWRAGFHFSSSPTLRT